MCLTWISRYSLVGEVLVEIKQMNQSLANFQFGVVWGALEEHSCSPVPLEYSKGPAVALEGYTVRIFFPFKMQIFLRGVSFYIKTETLVVSLKLACY